VQNWAKNMQTLFRPFEVSDTDSDNLAGARNLLLI